MPKTNKMQKKQKNKGINNKKLIQKKENNVYILYTGGTIGMFHNDREGLVPNKKMLIKLIKGLKIPDYIKVKYSIEVLSDIIDSSNIQTQNWFTILQKLKENYHKYDSFIVIHGTDTLAFTASLLSFYCKNWRKSVVVTGSQIPMFEFRNDAVRNIVDSVIISVYNIPQVFIVFGGKCFRANCTTKYSSTSFLAYRSPNIKSVGEFGVYLKLNYDVIDNGNVTLPNNIENNFPRSIKLSNWSSDIQISTITIVPGYNWKRKAHLIFQEGTKPNAIILRSFGIGNAPVSSSEFIDFLKEAHKHKIIIVNTTQCFEGGINMNVYKTGRLLKKNFVLTSSNMTYESIYTKLFYLFQIVGKNKIGLVKKLFETNIAGEIPSDKYYKFSRKTMKKKNKEAFLQFQEI